MRLVLLISALACLAFPALAQTAIGGGTANAYYQACMDRADERMSLSAQESLCSCASARMMVMMSVQELATMNPDPKHPGRAAYNKMLMNVYGPCMQHPVEERLTGECERDRHIRAFSLRDPGALCRCMAQQTGTTFEQNAPDIVRRLLYFLPGMEDPLEPIMNDATFRQRAYDNLYACLHLGN